MKLNLEFTEGWSSGELLEKVSSFRGGVVGSSEKSFFPSGVEQVFSGIMHYLDQVTPFKLIISFTYCEAFVIFPTKLLLCD